MKINTAIKKIMKEQKITQQNLAQAIGAKAGQAIARKLYGDNLTINSVVQYLDALGYELVIQPKKPGPRATDQILVDQVDTEEDQKYARKHKKEAKTQVTDTCKSDQVA